MAEQKKYVLGDMQCLYFIDEENGQTDLAILPTDIEYCEAEKEKKSLIRIVLSRSIL